MLHAGIRRGIGANRAASWRTGPGTTVVALVAKWPHPRIRRTLPWSTLGPDIDLFELLVHVVEMRLRVRMGRTKWVAGNANARRRALSRSLPVNEALDRVQRSKIFGARMSCNALKRSSCWFGGEVECLYQVDVMEGRPCGVSGDLGARGWDHVL